VLPIFVAVDPEGLFFFEDQPTDESQLRIKLSKLSGKTKEPLTLVIIADKSVPYEFIIKIGSIAHSAGINKICLLLNHPQFKGRRECANTQLAICETYINW
jgi:biopolymer transport protein ExbD